jgi:hypothetical protein
LITVATKPDGREQRWSPPVPTPHRLPLRRVDKDSLSGLTRRLGEAIRHFLPALSISASPLPTCKAASSLLPSSPLSIFRLLSSHVNLLASVSPLYMMRRVRPE